jgi:hypothetical protein
VGGTEGAERGISIDGTPFSCAYAMVALKDGTIFVMAAADPVGFYK